MQIAFSCIFIFFCCVFNSHFFQMPGLKRKRAPRKSKLKLELSKYMNMDVSGIIEDYVKSVPTELVGQVFVYQPSCGGAAPKAVRVTGFTKSGKSVFCQPVPFVYYVPKILVLDRLCGGACKLDVNWLNNNPPNTMDRSITSRYRWWKNRTRNEMQCVIIIETHKYHVQHCLDFYYKWCWTD